MASTTQPKSSSLRRLYHVEKTIVHVVELTGLVVEDLGSQAGPRKDVLATHALEFMKSMKEIQSLLHEEIKSMSEYRPLENSDYLPRIGAEITLKKIDCLLGQLENVEKTLDKYQAS